MLDDSPCLPHTTVRRNVKTSALRYIVPTCCLLLKSLMLSPAKMLST